MSIGVVWRLRVKIAVFFPAIYHCIEDVAFFKQENC